MTTEELDTGQEFLDVPITEYAADALGSPPSLNSGLANRLLSRSPLHAWYAHPRLNPECVRETSDAMDFGTAVHSALLEGIDIVEPLDYPDWRTKASKEERDLARAEGRVPLLVEDAMRVGQMVDAAQLAIATSPDLAGLGELDSERTFLWCDGDAWLRCRPDWVTRDRTIILSYKTTSANAEPDAYSRNIVSMGYELQAAFELEGVKASTGRKVESYIWIVQEVQPPYAVSLLGLSPEMREYGLNRMDQAIKLWNDCITTDRWPGYPTRVCYVQPPAWMLNTQRAEMELGQ